MVHIKKNLLENNKIKIEAHRQLAGLPLTSKKLLFGKDFKITRVRLVKELLNSKHTVYSDSPILRIYP